MPRGDGGGFDNVFGPGRRGSKTHIPKSETQADRTKRIALNLSGQDLDHALLLYGAIGNMREEGLHQESYLRGLDATGNEDLATSHKIILAKLGKLKVIEMDKNGYWHHVA